MTPSRAFLFWHLSIVFLLTIAILVLFSIVLHEDRSVDLGNLRKIGEWAIYAMFLGNAGSCLVCARTLRVGFRAGAFGWFLGNMLLLAVMISMVFVAALSPLLLLLYPALAIVLIWSMIRRWRRSTAPRHA